MPDKDNGAPEEPLSSDPEPDEGLYDAEDQSSIPLSLQGALEPSDEDYAAFDPAEMGNSAGYSDEDHQEPVEPEPEVEGPVAFDSRYTDQFEGLLYLGMLTKTFHWMGHKFIIRTLTTDEILEVGMIHQPYVGSLAEVKAYQAATVAACLVSVDDRPLPIPITNDVTDTLMATRFTYVSKRWSPIIMDVVYNQYLELEATVNQVLISMGKA